MLSKTYSNTWLSVESVCGMGDIGGAKRPSPIHYLTLTSSGDDFPQFTSTHQKCILTFQTFPTVRRLQ